MTATEFGTVTAADTVRFDRLLPGPIERVWAFLTEPDKRAQWLAGGPMELRAGGKVELQFNHASLTKGAEPTPERFKKHESGVTIHGHVTRSEPPRLLSYTWGGESGVESEVTFELTPQGDKVRLLLTHRRLPDRKAMLGVGSGWHTHLGVLADRLAGREPVGFWSNFLAVEAEYKKLLQID
jgi:uncharacterized protein YndB with AHSA1/START domain